MEDTTKKGALPVTELKDKVILNNPAGETIYLFLLVKKVELRVAKNQSKFLDMVVCDRDNIINVKKFNVSEKEKMVKPGDVIKICGIIGSYNGAPQLEISQFRKAKPDEVSIDALVPSSAKTGEVMYKEVEGYINGIEDSDFKTLLQKIYLDNKDELMKSAAALHMHHMVRGGLLLHITTMAKLGLSVSLVYPELNKDLLMTAILLHDIGKLEELKRENTGLAEDFTKRGKLFGHLNLGALYVHDICRELKIPAEKEENILHCIFAHHGEPEFGSNVSPLTVEAYVLHNLDLLDSKVYAFQDALKGVNPGEFSEKVYALKNKNVYYPELTLENNQPTV